MKLKKKRILLGVSGSIAAYKALVLTRLLIKEGAEVQIVMTEAAKSFVGPLSFSTLSKRDVLSKYFDEQSGAWSNHVELGLWPDLMLVAPATANTVAKMAHGLCDDLLQAIYLSARCKVVVAPAMDLEMYIHPSFKDNLALLKTRGIEVIEAESGELASGLSGQGRMAEPENILSRIIELINPVQSLKGKNFLVNAGPTYEKIDPVRFIGNRSTGKMGTAIANELSRRGGNVELVLGPCGELNIDSNINVHRVETAGEMYEKCLALFPKTHAAILSAAVADFTPASPSNEKIKKGKGPLSLELKRTTDILAELGQIKGDKFLVGFAMETENELANAEKKIHTKKADLIVLNSLRDKGAGFGHDTNKVTLLFKDGKKSALELKTKTEVASDIVDVIETALNK